MKEECNPKSESAVLKYKWEICCIRRSLEDFMNSIVLELQRELLNKNCDILQMLRRAHVIAFKLNLSDFDVWIQNELNGY